MGGISEHLAKPPRTPMEVWRLFGAAADGDNGLVSRLIGEHPEWMHHQVWYEFPIHYAVREGHADVVKTLLDAGCNPAFSNFNYSSWQTLLPITVARGYDDVREVLIESMRERFNFRADYSQLWGAISSGRLDRVKEIVSLDPSLISIGDEHGNGALHWAVLSRRISIIEWLLDEGADLQAQRADGQTPLHLSTVGDYWYRKNNTPAPDVSSETVTQRLLQRGAAPEFCVTVSLGNLELVKQELANAPALAQQQSTSRRSPLFHAARKGHSQIVGLLLDDGADPNRPEECADDGRALWEASSRNDLGMMQLLLAHGANADAYVDSSGNCLSIADRGGERAAEAMRLLIKHGAQPGHWTLDTPEKLAVRIRDERPLDPDSDLWCGVLNSIMNMDRLDLLQQFVDRFGKEPMRTMNPTNGWRVPGSKKMLDAVLANGMSVDARDWYGRTLLHHASMYSSPEHVRWLIERNATLDVIDHLSGTTPLGLAAWAGRKESVSLLLDAGADSRLPREKSWATPIGFASEQGHADVVAMLREIE